VFWLGQRAVVKLLFEDGSFGRNLSEQRATRPERQWGATVIAALQPDEHLARVPRVPRVLSKHFILHLFLLNL
jgi:hypothetical protein